MAREGAQTGACLGFTILALVLIWLFTAPTLAQEQRENLGIFGCNVRDVAIRANPSLVLAACDGPRGIFSSTDFGNRWSFAGGDSYPSGAALGVAITSHGAFALKSSGNSLFKSTFDGEGGLLKTWGAISLEELGSPSRSPGIESVGDFVVLGVENYTDGGVVTSLLTLNTATEGFGSPATLPGFGTLLQFALVNGGEGSDSIFALTRGASGFPGTRTLYRASFDFQTGAIGSWSEITSNITNLLSGELEDGYVDGVYAGPNETVLVRASALGALKRVFQSANNGDTFQITVPNGIDGFPQDAYYAPGNVTFACHSGPTAIVNSFLTKDGGLNWSKFKSTISGTFNLFDDDLCVFDPADSAGNNVLVKSVDGFIASSNLQSTPPTFVKATEGLEGIIVQGFARSAVDPDTVALVTNAGLAVTRNFSSSSRSWLFPTCNSGPSCWDRAIAIDPFDPTVIFSGTEYVERGVLSGGGEEPIAINWTKITNNPNDNGWDSMRFYTSPHLPNVIVVTFSSFFDDPNTEEIERKKGGIYLYNATTGATIHSGLVDKPVNGVAIINSQLIYAAVDYSPALVTPEDRGVYRTTDGGANWTLITANELPTYPGVRVFAYDSSRDLLVAGGNRGSGDANFYHLVGASENSTEWVRLTAQSALFTPNALTINPNDGSVFASAGNTIYRSTDNGLNWESYFAGVTDEEFNVIAPFEPEPEVESLTAGLDPLALLTGSSLGFSKLTGAVSSSPSPTATPTATGSPEDPLLTPTATPTEPGEGTPQPQATPTATPAPTASREELNCALKTTPEKVRGVFTGRYLFTLQVRSQQKKPLAKVVTTLESENPSGDWIKVQSRNTNKVGKVVLLRRIKKTARFRFVVDTAEAQCTSNLRKIVVKSKKIRRVS